jgi:hypothetical protein
VTEGVVPEFKPQYCKKKKKKRKRKLSVSVIVDVETSQFLCIVGRMQNCAAVIGNSLAVPQ